MTEAGKQIGFGHLTRCIALDDILRVNGLFAEFILYGDNSCLDLLKGRKYSFFNWIRDEKKTLDLIRDADIAVVDSYLAKYEFYKNISRILRMPVYIDDTKRFEYPKGTVINGSIYAKELNYPKKEEVKYLLGTNYTLLRKEFWDVPQKEINEKIKEVLITFGGMNYSNLTHKIVNYLKNKFDFNFYIVDSKKNRHDAKEMLKLMLQADICISSGGQTTYELARTGVPTIRICFAENQKLNLKGWQEKGFIEDVGWYNKNNLLEKLTGAVEKLISYKERVRRSLIGKNCVDGKGVKRIVNLIFPRKSGHNEELVIA